MMRPARREKITRLSREITERICREVTSTEERAATLETIVTAVLALNEQQNGLLRHDTTLRLGMIMGNTLKRFTGDGTNG